ncbi:MAG: TolC family outer membrane protein [Geminicoccaceae bacterium]|nr:TolC family outer membrane protein [Geminicoccaceae bacterium]MCB9967467.1 TolC family outer membrane protein [Geminicoccaceae bacterium]HRY27406.1 TolC family outer membrane protein [Geminicoccaceae bacterium]
MRPSRVTRARLIALLLALTPASVSAAVTLPTALSKAYLENPTLVAARARLRAADEGVPIARASRRPQIAATTGASVGLQESNRGSRSTSSFRQALGIEQPLYTGGEASARIGRAETLVEAERARLEAVEQAVLLAAIEAFTAVLQAQRVLELALGNETRLGRQLEAVQRRYRFGELTQTDVAQAEARYARGIADREAAAGELETAGAAYRKVIGDPPGTLVEPVMPADLPPDEQAALERIADNPNVRAADFGVGVARREVDVALSALKPRLKLRGEASYVDEPSGRYDWQSDVSIGAVLSIPLYQGGGEYGRIRQTRQLLTEGRYTLESARRDVREDIQAAWQDLQTARARGRSLARQVESAALALDGVRQESLVGARTVLDVLDAEQELFDAEVAAAAAARDSIVAAYRLKAGMGELTAMALDLDAVPYDPDAYYQEVRSAWFGTGDSAADDPPGPETDDDQDGAVADDADAEGETMDTEAMPEGG